MRVKSSGTLNAPRRDWTSETTQMTSCTTQRQPGVIPAPNRLNREFSTDIANRKWVSDFTYIDTAKGWLFLAVVLDLFSRKAVGWAMSEQMNTAPGRDRLAYGFTGTPPHRSSATPFRSRQPIHQCCLSEHFDRCKHPNEYEPGWKLL
jgi:transposase InsO family protein